MNPYPSPGTIILTPPPPPPADPAPAVTDEATPHFCLLPKEPHPSPLECCELLSNGGTHHTVRSSNAKEAELDDDAVAKAIIAIVDLLPKLGSGKEVEQGRIGSALSKKKRVVSLSLLTLFVCPEALCQALYFRNRSVLSSISLRTLLLLLVSSFLKQRTYIKEKYGSVNNFLSSDGAKKWFHVKAGGVPGCVF
jgi:hypothetical protein